MPTPEKLSAIVMAAGKGTRLKSQTPKVLHSLFGKPLLGWVLDSLSDLAKTTPIDKTWVIVGHGREKVDQSLQCLDSALPAIHLQPSVIQEPQLGTGHAIQQVKASVTDLSGAVLVLSGDVPLLRTESLEMLVEKFIESDADLTLMAAHLENPTGYGRVIVDSASQQVQKIIEEKDANATEKLTTLVNTGIYCLRWESISPLLDKLSANNAQAELYLTDAIAHAVEDGLKVTWVHLEDPLEMCGINQRLDLSICHEILHQRALSELMQNGVTLLHPGSTLISPKAKIGADTVIYPGCTIESDVEIGQGCTIGPNTTMIGHVRVGNHTMVLQSFLRGAEVGNHCTIGPFAHLRDQAILKDNVRIGNFVEVKTTEIDANTNAAHLAYLGDASLGQDVNIGAGTIIANYDPIRDIKHRSVLEDGVKIGCNSVLVSPVNIRERSCVAAGSVITEDVAPWDLAIARQKQSSIPQWVKKVLGQPVAPK
ncbi:MAG: bifunctional UDP-N-acetylglucosamine diphosphorylase/glucosamine-1-phosphate N-acetyltransferase GlmU [Vampirovibrionales bacterium]|nr:bifunctional UDP-N-acetylglucosamine diphosphorylase/glucosamine-1-phosphate N-acetyltransferase GlmU [Vampirovibrionales bacterium]